MNKPKEYELFQAPGLGQINYWIPKSDVIHANSINAIEKSAYDELQAENERLKAELTSLAAAKDIEIGAKYFSDYQELKAENERLRVALEQVHSGLWDSYYGKGLSKEYLEPGPTRGGEGIPSSIF